MCEKDIRLMFLKMQAEDLNKRLHAVNMEIAESNNNFEKLQHLPSEQLFGYKWVRDENHDLYIVKLEILGWYWLDSDVYHTLDYVSDKVKIADIFRVRDNSRIKRIDAFVSAYVDDKIKYSIGTTISKKTWFCFSVDNLLRSQGQTLKMLYGNIIDVYADPPTIIDFEGKQIQLADF